MTNNTILAATDRDAERVFYGPNVRLSAPSALIRRGAELEDASTYEILEMDVDDVTADLPNGTLDEDVTAALWDAARAECGEGDVVLAVR